MVDPDSLSLERHSLSPADNWSAPEGGFLVVFAERGRASYICASSQGSQKLSVGGVLVLHGPCKIAAVGMQPFRFACFSFSSSHLTPLLTKQEIARLRKLASSIPSVRFHPANSPVARRCHQYLAGLPHASYDQLDRRAVLLRIALAALSEGVQGTANAGDSDSVDSEPSATETLEKLTAEEIIQASVKQLAIRCGCSSRHLQRLFLQFFGMSASALRMELRLQKAATLLRSSGLTKISIAEQCGFHHISLFHRCFRRRFGVSPRQWRMEPASGLAPKPFELVHANPECRTRLTELCQWEDIAEEFAMAKVSRRRRGSKRFLEPRSFIRS